MALQRQRAAALVRLILEQIQRAGLHIANLEHDRLAALMMLVTVETSHCNYLLYCGQVSPVLYLSLLYNLRTEISTLFYLAYRLVSHAGT